MGGIDIFSSEIVYWLSVTLACSLGAMSPGPSVAVVINYTMSGDRWVGLWCAWGHGIAVGIYAFISAFGLLVVFEKSVLVYSIVQLLGVGILLLLGIKLLTSKTPVISVDDQVLSQSRWQAARDGFLIAFVNPKALVFFTAVFSQFLYQGMSVVEKFGLVFIASSVDALWYTLVSLLIIQTTALKKLQKYALVINKLFGGLLIFYCIYFIQQILSKESFSLI